VTAPRLLYLHGFGSGPGSQKAVRLADRFARRGVPLERLDLRVPSLERLRLTAILEATRAAIGGARDRAVLIGSSLGGLAAARLAEDEPRVSALVLLAPAFRFHERWRERLGDEGFRAWRDTGWIETMDFAEQRMTRVDFGFAEDVRRLEESRGGDGWPDVRVPTLILHGRADDVILLESSRRFAAGRPHVELVELDDGHELLATLDRIGEHAERFLAPWIGPARAPRVTP
jgi:pimeloyl-ACP methyl ester carboxylesterase